MHQQSACVRARASDDCERPFVIDRFRMAYMRCQNFIDEYLELLPVEQRSLFRIPLTFDPFGFPAERVRTFFVLLGLVFTIRNNGVGGRAHTKVFVDSTGDAYCYFDDTHIGGRLFPDTVGDDLAMWSDLLTADGTPMTPDLGGALWNTGLRLLQRHALGDGVCLGMRIQLLGRVSLQCVPLHAPSHIHDARRHRGFPRP